ncbi:MAG: energy-coupling factor transporter transmembrane protein EcfT [Clostridiales bacterium]|nr:energy-coupling factor transporter transmembrane protein EcfT [Clostridiales bacterium]
MLADITIGQYFPGNSVLHRMDPRVKLILTFVYIIAVFFPKNWLGLALATAYLIFSVCCSRLPLRLVWKSIRPILPLIMITSALNIFYSSKGVELFHWGFLRITSGGLITAAFIAVRILCLIAGSSLLTYTTSPTTLTDALERLLRPLKALHINVHELSMMMTIALRFIPTLIEETDKIMSAQKARGADMESGGLLQRIRALIPVLIPLFVSSFRRAYELATAMECRCYHGGDGRTRMKQLHMTQLDGWCLLSMILLIAGVVALNFLIPAVL